MYYLDYRHVLGLFINGYVELDPSMALTALVFTSPFATMGGLYTGAFDGNDYSFLTTASTSNFMDLIRCKE